MIFTLPVCSDLIHARHNDREKGRPFSGFKTLPQPPLHKSIRTSVQGGQKALVKIKLCYPAESGDGNVSLLQHRFYFQLLAAIANAYVLSYPCVGNTYSHAYTSDIPPPTPLPHYQTVCMLSCACHRVVFPPYTGVMLSCTCYLFYVLSQYPNAYNSLRPYDRLFCRV